MDGSPSIDIKRIWQTVGQAYTGRFLITVLVLTKQTDRRTRVFICGHKNKNKNNQNTTLTAQNHS